MPYSVNNTDSSKNFTVQDGTVDNSTLSVSLIGTNAENYADDLARNDVQLLENFASTSAPTAGTVLTGQLWYDKTDNVLRVYNGNTNGWVNLQPQVLGTAPIGTGARTNKKGELYFDTSNNKFYIYDGAQWRPTGYGGEVTSEQSSNALVNNPTKFGSKVRSIFLKDTSGVPRPCLALVHVNDSTTNEFYGSSTNGETIMAIFNHTTGFTADNVLSETEGENINYYAELNSTGSIGVDISKGMNLRKDYIAEAVALATEAITAQKANALFRGGQVVSATSIITDDISFIPTGAAGSLTLGSQAQYFDTLFAQRIKLGDGGQAEIETETDNLGILGSANKSFADVFTYDVHAKADVNVGAILSVTGNSNLTGNTDITNNLQVNQNIRSNATVFGSTLTDNTLQINTGSITGAINGTFSGTVQFGTLSDGALPGGITDFVDEDNMASDSANKLPTQQSVKAYVDTANANMKTYVETQDKAQDLDFVGDSGTGAVVIGNATVDSASMTFTGGDGIETSASGTTLTIDVDNSVARTDVDETFDQNVIITGNLTVNGTQTTLNTATLDVEDLNITVGTGATSSSATNGAGLTFGNYSGNPTLIWDHTNSRLAMNKPLATNLVGNVTGNVTGNLTGDVTGDVTGTVSSIANHSTTNLSEGTNLYYTTARADARIGLANLSDLNNVSTDSPTSNQVLQWNGSAWAPATTAAGVTDLGDLGDVDDTSTSGQVLTSDGSGNFTFSTVSTANYYVDGLSFNTGTGVLTASVNGTTNQTVDLDGRYSTTDTVYSTATSSTAGILKIGYSENGKNYPLELNGSDQAFVNVPWTDTTYSLPLASSSTRGGVKIGYSENGKNYPVELSSEKMFVNVPWTDNNDNTTYTAGAGLTLVGTEFRHDPATSSVTNLTASARRYVTGLTFDTYGHVTGYTHATETVVDTNDNDNYYLSSASYNSSTGVLTLNRSGLSAVTVNVGVDTNTNTTYSQATSSTLGLVKIGYSENGKNYPVELSSGQMYVNVPWTDTDTDTNTTYSAGTGMSLSGTTFSIGQAVGTSSTVQFGLIRSTGDIVAYYSSDERLKDNVKPIENALEKLQKIRGVEFDWNDKQDVYEGHDTGVIAQEVQKVLPEVVTEREDGMLAVKYEKMMGLLIESIKDLKAEVDELKQQLGK